MKSGDQVWHPDTQRSITIAAIEPDEKRGGRFAVADPESAELPGEEWIGLDAVTLQRAATRDEERAMLLRIAKRSGRAGAAARAEIARQWGDGTWTK